MAAFYWVGGSATWSSAANWAGTSGGPAGTGGSPTNTTTNLIPSATSDVYFDSNSGSGTCTVTYGGGTSALCLTLSTVGFAGTITATQGTAYILIYGNKCTLGSTGTFDPPTAAGGGGFPKLIFVYAGTVDFTTGGQTVGYIDVASASTTVKLVDDLITKSTHQLTLSGGTFHANNKNVSIGYFSDAGSGTSKTLIMGDGTWSLLQAGPLQTMVVNDAGTNRGPESVWYIGNPSTMTLHANNSILRFTLCSDAAGLYSSVPSSGGTTITTVDNLSTAGWPSTGTVLIDNEQITYSAVSGNTLTISARSANFTTMAAHNAGAAALLLKDKTTTLLSSITSSTDPINVAAGGTTNFEAVGFLAVDSEIIKYTLKTTGASNTFTGTTLAGTSYPLERGNAMGGAAASHTARSNTIIRQCEARNFYAGGKTYNIIEFYSIGIYQYLWTYIYGGFTATTLRSAGVSNPNTGFNNLIFDTNTYTVTNMQLGGTNYQPLLIKKSSAPWNYSANANSYNIVYYTTGVPGDSTNNLLPYVDTKSDNFNAFIMPNTF